MTQPTVARTMLSVSAALVGGALAAAALPIAVGTLWTAAKYGVLSPAEAVAAVLFALGLAWLGWWMHRRALATARGWTSEHGSAKRPRSVAWFLIFLGVWPICGTVLLASASDSAHGFGPPIYLLILGTPLMALGGGLLGLGNWMLRRME